MSDKKLSLGIGIKINGHQINFALLGNNLSTVKKLLFFLSFCILFQYIIDIDEMAKNANFFKSILVGFIV